MTWTPAPNPLWGYDATKGTPPDFIVHRMRSAMRRAAENEQRRQDEARAQRAERAGSSRAHSRQSR